VGWPQEVARLLAEGHASDLTALKPLGYGRWLAGGDPKPVEADIVLETQLYAKRQATWFRNQLPEVPVWDPDIEPLEMAFLKLGLG
jgi:tRNA dimethylallyltransferase